LRRARLFSIIVALGATMLTGGVVAAAGNVVHITSTLDPATITIAPGERITWRNDDDERHRIRTTSGPTEFDSGNLEPGQSFRVTLSRPGRYEYYDHRNDELTRYYGTVIVKDGAIDDPQARDGPGADAPSRATIAIGDRVFRPRNVTIAARGSVTWRNDDDREHTATGTGGNIDTGVLSPGESARASFPNPGTFSFLCVIHPEMTGTVTVTGTSGGAPPTATPTSSSPTAAKPSPTLQTTPTPEPSGAASPPTNAGPAQPGDGGAAETEGAADEDVGAAAASRNVGAALLGIAAGGGMLLLAGAGIAAARAPRDPRPLGR
jgi:plastocyanin